MVTLKRDKFTMNRRINLANEWAIVYTPFVIKYFSNKIHEGDCEKARLKTVHEPREKHQMIGHAHLSFELWASKR